MLAYTQKHMHLQLDPRPVRGWSPQRESTRTAQPFGRRTVRWADDPDNGGPDEADDAGQVSRVVVWLQRLDMWGMQ